MAGSPQEHVFLAVAQQAHRSLQRHLRLLVLPLPVCENGEGMTPDGPNEAAKMGKAPSYLGGTSWAWSWSKVGSSSGVHPPVSTPGNEVWRDAVVRRWRHSLLT